MSKKLILVLLSLVLILGFVLGCTSEPVTVTETKRYTDERTATVTKTITQPSQQVPVGIMATSGSPVATNQTTTSTSATVTQLTTTISTTVSDTVYITNSGAKYHRASCRYLSKSSIPISRSDAIKKGYGACSVCKP